MTDVHQMTDRQLAEIMPTLDDRALNILCDALDGVLCGVCARATDGRGDYCALHGQTA